MTISVFVLAPGRSFTSVVCAMLGEHPDLFGLPETNLTMADTIGQWMMDTGGWRRMVLRPGLLRTIAYLETGEETTATVLQAEAWLRDNADMPTRALYQMLRNSVAPRGLVEKSPTSIHAVEYINRLMDLAPDSYFLHLTRHPYSNIKSIYKAEWYKNVLESGFEESYDYRQIPPVFDPQFYWLESHKRILNFKQRVAPEKWLQMRGEDLLENPDTTLAEICRWLGIDDSADAIGDMKHPERSPFAHMGPMGGGNDPNFLENPALRPYTAPPCPLHGALPWREDGAEFAPQVQAMARDFGYEHAEPVKPPQKSANRKLIRIEPDGAGAPMPHCNILDNSLAGLPPLQSVSSVRHIPYPAFGGINFGAYTGEKYAVSVYEGTREPALMAFDLDTGEPIWQTPMDVMQQSGDVRGRWVGGVLLAKLHFDDGSMEHRVFASNRSEAVCLDDKGKILWRRAAAEILGNPTETLGTPRCLRCTRDQKILFATAHGNLVKLDPLNGEVVDVYRMDGQARVEGQVVTGRYGVRQSVVLIGDHVYIQAGFEPDTPRKDDSRQPVSLLRMDVSGDESGKIRHMAPADDTGASPDRVAFAVKGNGMQGGSPSGMTRADGTTVILANGHTADGGFAVHAIADEGGTLRRQWRMVLPESGDATITAAPANDPVTGAYLCATKANLYVVLDAANRSGDLVPDATIPAMDLLSADFRKQAASAELSSPYILARHENQTGFVCYVGLGLTTQFDQSAYAVLSAIEVDIRDGRVRTSPLWTAPLVLDEDGNPVPSPPSYAQPAPFAYTDGAEARTGIIMGSVRDGVAILR
ncbi:MAG: sulfotransferase [Marinibacterium sp.]